MRIIFMGTPDFSVPVLDALVGAGHDICAVYSQPPRPAGRGKKERPGPVHARAETLGLTVRHPVSLKSEEALAEYQNLKADIAVVVAYGLILTQAILDAPTHGCLNIHASLLPRWRGAAPIHRAIMAGDADTGVCIMQMEAGLDTGPVLLRKSTPIAVGETTGALHDRLSAMGATAIVAALDKLRDLTAVPQPEDGVTYASKIDKAEARVDWTQPVDKVIAQINGLSPFPGAWAQAGGERIKFLSASPSKITASVGQIICDEDGLHVGAAGGALRIRDFQRAGKKPSTSRDVLRGWTPPTHFD